jgi:hypothetical protein
MAKKGRRSMSKITFIKRIGRGLLSTLVCLFRTTVAVFGACVSLFLCLLTYYEPEDTADSDYGVDTSERNIGQETAEFYGWDTW